MEEYTISSKLIWLNHRNRVLGRNGKPIVCEPGQEPPTNGTYRACWIQTNISRGFNNFITWEDLGDVVQILMWQYLSYHDKSQKWLPADRVRLHDNVWSVLLPATIKVCRPSWAEKVATNSVDRFFRERETFHKWVSEAEQRALDHFNQTKIIER